MLAESARYAAYEGLAPVAVEAEILRAIRVLLLLSVFGGGMLGLGAYIIIGIGASFFGKRLDLVDGYIFYCCVGCFVVCFAASAIRFFRSDGDSSRASTGLTGGPFQSRPFRCSHGVAFGRNGKRCTLCVAEVAGLHATVRRNLEHVEGEITILERRHRAEQASVDVEHRARLETMTGLQRMDPYEFERLVARVFSALGWDARSTKRSGDGGVDVIATRNGVRTVIQCKRYASENKVGSPEIQMLYGAMAHDGASAAMFVTTSTFTDGARRAAHKLRIELVDGPELLRMMRQVKL